MERMRVRFCFFPKQRKQGHWTWVGIFRSCNTGAITQHLRVKAANYLETRNSSGCSEGAGLVPAWLGSVCLMIEAKLHTELSVFAVFHWGQNISRDADSTSHLHTLTKFKQTQENNQEVLLNS